MGEGINLKTDLYVKKICGIDYLEQPKGYAAGESCAFWRLYYIDKGILRIIAEETALSLQGGDCCLLKPGTKYGISSGGENAKGLIILSFECSEFPSALSGKVFSLTNDEKRILGSIIKEAKEVFSDFPSNTKLKQGAEENGQMISLLLPLLLIDLKRSALGEDRKNALLRNADGTDIIASVIAFLEENVSEKLHFKDVAAFAKISATALKTLFSKRVGCGVMEYFVNLKIQRAKKLIRETDYNITEISRLLGYDSLHYFSRQFKQKTGMSPTEYANSARIFTEE